MLEDLGNAALAILAGVIGLATLSVIIGQKSQAPAALQAGGGAIASIIAAAVSPQNTASTNGNPAASTQSSSPALIQDLINQNMVGA
jgi:hypothetical protein